MHCVNGASHKVKFCGDYGELLTFAESIDFMQIYETKKFEKFQLIDIIGDIIGFDTIDNKLYIGTVG